MTWRTIWRDTDKTIEVNGAGDERVTPEARAVLNIRHDYGASGDGSTDDTGAFVRAVADALTLDVPLHIPPGTYVVAANALNVHIPAGGSFVLTGDGPQSVIRRMSGSTPQDGCELFNITAAGAAHSVAVRNLRVDDNARGNPIPEGKSEWGLSHCHTFRLGPSSPSSIRTATFEGVTLEDPVADGISISTANTIGTLRVDGMTVTGRTRTRSDIQFSAPVDRAFISRCDLSSLEMEWITSGVMDLHIQDVRADTIDLMPKVEDSRCLISARGLRGGLVALRAMSGVIADSQLTTNDSLSDIRWTKGLTFRNCDFRVAGLPVSILATQGDLRPDTDVTFDSCTFGPAPAGHSGGPFVKILPIPEIHGDRQRVTFRSCRFDDGADYGLDADRCGTVRVIDTQLAGHVAGVRVMGGTGFTVAVTIDGGDCSAPMKHTASGGASVALRDWAPIP